MSDTASTDKKKNVEENLSVVKKSEVSTTNVEAPIPEGKDECVVCFKIVEIYSIGECDHPVCYECSTRMRVLCQRNECPICRHVLAKVIFTNDKMPYRELETKHRSEYFNRRYKIGFSTSAIQQAFFNLLDHPCPKCNTKPYRTFDALKNHVRKEHNLYFCDICTENLKIFTFERRCYTPAELGIHRSRGDADNKSHRGHPLCEYCKQRYLDQYELFRHLRREHYFCHFCDADGFNEFYGTYESLADHFRKDHYLCEEGKCATEQFIGAFRSEIDYKAHVASVHGKNLSKQQAKQTRTLQLEITLGPRSRNGPSDAGVANVRGQNDEHAEIAEMTTMHPTQRPVGIDADNEDEFPSLAGTTATPTLSLARPPPQSLRRSTASGLARTKENFPALGGESGGGSSGSSASTTQSKAPSISSLLKKPSVAVTGAIPRTTTASLNGNSSGVVLHVSNRPTTSSTAAPTSAAANQKNAKLDFPALPTNKNKKNLRQLDMDAPAPPSQVPLGSVSAKHRTLVDDYVSVANPAHFQKIQMVQKEELDKKTKKEKLSAPKLTSEEFPSLGRNSNSPTLANGSWAKPISEKKQRELENRKSKVAPAPVLPANIKKPNTNKKTTTPAVSKANVINLSVSVEATVKKDNVKSNNKAKEKNNNENKSNSNMNSSNDMPSHAKDFGKHNGDLEKANTMRPPPGFKNQSQQSSSLKNNAPPGFHSDVTVNSVAKSPNNLTFTTSLGQNYSIISTHTYMQPPDAMLRNQRLVGYFKESLQSQEALDEFRQISQCFRDGSYNASAYYDHCKAALKNNFDSVFPELLVLLPDISKQQALYLVHSQNLYTMDPNERKLLPKLEVCSICKQVLLNNDLGHHKQSHDFPTLGSGGSGVVGNRKA